MKLFYVSDILLDRNNFLSTHMCRYYCYKYAYDKTDRNKVGTVIFAEQSNNIVMDQ